jgi:protein SCO1/2
MTRYPRVVTTGGYVLLVLVCFLAGYLLVPVSDDTPRTPVSTERVRLPEPQPVGDFTLQDIGGGTYDRDRLLGQWTLVYFGYSHCPDVCRPTLVLLTGLARALEARPGAARPLEVVFVTVDPARDTPAVLRAWLADSDGEVTGLSGSEKQIATLATRLGIMHLPGKRDAAGNYLVDHPATILVIDPEAHLRAGFPFPHDAERIVEQMADIVREFVAGRAG